MPLAAAVEAGAAHLRATCGPPYVVRWVGPSEIYDGRWPMVGHFESVVGYSTAHIGVWEFERYDVKGAAGSEGQPKQNEEG